ncbi:MAG TPA: RNA methyltransferase [Puia sp.]|jgi:23S rRNA (guanosine2251-2'-O)-methyltransferase|nr:RNA methyltransferase [Puia sp.]
MQKLSMSGLNRKSISEFKESKKMQIIVVLDNVRSRHNVGSVFRTADAFLLQGVYLCGYTPQPPHRDIHKTALGATESVEWKYFGKALDILKSLRSEGYRLFAVEQVKGSIHLQKFSFEKDDKLAIVFGNEVSGVGEEALKLCDGCIEIPQLGMKHSLNISVAAGIVLWELVRTRIEKDFKD